MHPVLLNLAGTWTGTHPRCWIDIITAAYYRTIYILFLACEHCYANGIHALWTAGFRWLISATHLQSVFVWGPVAWWQWCFFQICWNWLKNNALRIAFSSVSILGIHEIYLLLYSFSTLLVDSVPPPHQIAPLFHYIRSRVGWSMFK